MYCKNCGSSVGDDSQFCPNCGSPLSSTSESQLNTYTNVSVSDNAPSKRKNPIPIIVIILLVLAIIATAIIGGLFGYRSHKINSLLELGDKYLAEENYEDALAAFEEIIEIDDKYVEAYLGAADAYIGMGDYDNAIKVLKEGKKVTDDRSIDKRLDKVEEEKEEMEQAAEAESVNNEILEQISKETFTCSSGVGGWADGLTFESDGRFEINGHDSDMGVSGPGYDWSISNYGCTGTVADVQKVDDHIYEMVVNDKIDNPDAGKEEIKDRARITYNGYSAIEEGSKMYVYTPGISLNELPEEYREWLGYLFPEESIVRRYGVFIVNADGYNRVFFGDEEH